MVQIVRDADYTLGNSFQGCVIKYGKFKSKSKNLSKNGNLHNLNSNQSLQDIHYNKCSPREQSKPQATGELIFRQEF